MKIKKTATALCALAAVLLCGCGSGPAVLSPDLRIFPGIPEHFQKLRRLPLSRQTQKKQAELLPETEKSMPS